MGVWHFSKFKKGVTRDSKNGLEAEVRGKDTRLFIHADAFVGKGYYAAAKTTKWGTYLNVPNVQTHLARVRPPLQGHPEQRTELQSCQRALFLRERLHPRIRRDRGHDPQG